MRILFLTPSLEVGGSELLTISYAAGMKARGHEVAIAYGHDDFQLPRAQARHIDTMWLTGAPLSGRTLGRWVRALRVGQRHFRADVVHAQSITAALACALALPRVPLLATVHMIAVDDERKAAMILRASRARVSAVSEPTAQGLRRFWYSPPVEVLPPAIDVAAMDRDASQPPPIDLPPGQIVCCVGRHNPTKGVDVLIRAFEDLAAREPQARLVLVGDGPDRASNEDLARSLGLEEHIVFAGNQMNPASFMKAADVVVLPSRREGLPIVALEALALGRPLVAARVDGTPAVVHDGRTGWLVPPEDPPALSAAIQEALDDRAEAVRRGEEGRSLIEQEYGLARQLDRVEALLVEAAGD